MNVGSLMSGLLTDGIREIVPEGGWAVGGTVLSTNRCLLFSGAVAQLAFIFVALTVREIDVKQVASGEHGACQRSFSLGCVVTPRRCVSDVESDKGTVAEKFEPKRGSPWSIFKEVGSTKRFWKFFLLTVILINIKMIFRHLDATLPKWLLRTCASSLHVPIPLVHLLPRAACAGLPQAC